MSKTLVERRLGRRRRGIDKGKRAVNGGALEGQRCGKLLFAM